MKSQALSRYVLYNGEEIRNDKEKSFDLCKEK